ncbi:MAG: phosphoribosylamine--glycine ligase [Clostridium sp.]|nr:phosphoribosylamine--glycine ligase [Prevotella sp.]MCM1429591.1 phosphoribosylamine--glycine ligase [Clostridium sp.]MCM1476070.1 phosphoribosylamine--glycine ligase [Muribaculaceae bacterium]
MKDIIDILLIGKGGRESALASKILRSPRCRKLYSTPSLIDGAIHADISALDLEALRKFVEGNSIDLVVVGPEAPIVSGIYEALETTGAKIIAPDTECARLEGSKEFAKEFMIRHAIPSPRFMSVTADTIDEGYSFLEALRPPYVVKADGLAAGRGVFISESLVEAKEMLSEMISGLFGKSSDTVIVEEYIAGRECSMFYAVDGDDWMRLPDAHDYKRYGDGDTGLNTAGLGAVSPAPHIDEEFRAKVEQRILIPTLKGLKEEGMDFRGFLYLGIVNHDGEPVILEYNVRLGDPETQVIIPRIESDIVDLLEGIADRTLALKKISVREQTAVGIVLVAKGYPGIPVKGDAIRGIESAESAGCMVFNGAVKKGEGDLLLTDGGRIATVVALADNLSEAAAKARRGADMIDFNGVYSRHDIGL